jgi:predicted Fe-Mo cluster-binding NifX family protein
MPKIACITDDGRTISQHFGRALHYAVLTIDDGQVVARELRDKLGHQQFSAQEEEEVPGQRHGTDAASHDKHVGMAQAIQDCEVLLCRGMGYGAYQSMQQVGIRPVVTNEVEIDAAVQAYIEGRLEDHPEKLH